VGGVNKARLETAAERWVEWVPGVWWDWRGDCDDSEVLVGWHENVSVALIFQQGVAVWMDDMRPVFQVPESVCFSVGDLEKTEWCNFTFHGSPVDY
jgi:hypothetical protein